MTAQICGVKGLSCGCEHELADISLDVELPVGYGRDTKDYTIVNSNGIANDPSGKLYRFGGEINTPPTSSVEGQVEVLHEILRLMPNAKINYRSNLHVHVRWPGLREDLTLLKRVQRFIHATMPRLLHWIEPIPRPDPLEYLSLNGEYAGAMRRYKRRKVSHHTLLTQSRLEKQLKAESVDEFFKLEVPLTKDGLPMWHLQPRLCVSLRQLLQTDTVEFRHFPGTLDGNELRHCVKWCVGFLEAAVDGTAGAVLTCEASARYINRHSKFPKFRPYDHIQELKYRSTCHDGSLTKAQILENIALIEAGQFERRMGLE
jgi:hypothetical protein